MTTRIKLTNQLDRSLQTRDSLRHDALGSALAEIEISLGVLDPSDLAKLRAILQKYVGGSSASVNELGMVRAGDARDAADDAARKSAAGVARNIAHNAEVGRGYRDFWDKKNADLRDSVRR